MPDRRARSTLGYGDRMAPRFSYSRWDGTQRGFDLDADLDDAELATLRRLTERYCVVYQTLSTAPDIQTSYAATPGV